MVPGESKECTSTETAVTQSHEPAIPLIRKPRFCVYAGSIAGVGVKLHTAERCGMSGFGLTSSKGRDAGRHGKVGDIQNSRILEGKTRFQSQTFRA
jgi:hypothetical protein